MKRLVYRTQEDGLNHPGDAQRIVRVCAERGYHVTVGDAHEAWEDYSSSMCAGWMFLPDDDDEVLWIVCRYLEAEDPDATT